MIIACPQCDTRFVVPSTIFAKGGRKMRCASCKHTWFQDDPMIMAAQSSNNQNKSKQTINTKASSPFLSKLKSDFIEGFRVIVGVAILVVTLFYAFHMMNRPVKVGQGVVFDKVIVERQNDGVMIKGYIVNSMDGLRGIPHISVQQILGNNTIGDTFVIKPKRQILGIGETLPFVFRLKNINQDIEKFNLQFIIEN